MMFRAVRVASCEAEAAEEGGHGLVVMATRTEEIPEFAMFAAVRMGRFMALEAVHAADPALDAAVVLLEVVVHIGAGAVPDCFAQHGADRPGWEPWPSVVIRSGQKLMVARAKRKKALAAFMSGARST